MFELFGLLDLMHARCEMISSLKNHPSFLHFSSSMGQYLNFAIGGGRGVWDYLEWQQVNLIILLQNNLTEKLVTYNDIGT